MVTKNWPNFFIVGVRKGATTSLYEYLKQVNGIFMPEIDEPSYFFADEYRPSGFKMAKTRSEEDYLKLYENVTNETLIGDGSASYYSDPKNPQYIKKIVPHAKIIFILRDPIQRTYSDFLHTFMHIAVKESFHETLQKIKKKIDDRDSNYPAFIQDSFYYETTKRYLDTFGNENVKILIFEEFIKKESESVKQVLDFLGSKEGVSELITVKHNSTHMPRGYFSRLFLGSKNLRNLAGKFVPESKKHSLINSLLLKWDVKKPPMQEKDKVFLHNIFADDVKNLQSLLNRKFPWFKDIKLNNEI